MMLLNLRRWLMQRWLPRSHDPHRKLCSLLPQVGIKEMKNREYFYKCSSKFLKKVLRALKCHDPHCNLCSLLPQVEVDRRCYDHHDHDVIQF